MYKIDFLPLFERDLKKYQRSGGDVPRVHEIIDMLRRDEILPPSLHDHQLHGALRQYRELHIKGDWLLMYQKDGKRFIITCLWLVSHKKLRERERSL